MTVAPDSSLWHLHVIHIVHRLRSECALQMFQFSSGSNFQSISENTTIKVQVDDTSITDQLNL